MVSDLTGLRPAFEEWWTQQVFRAPVTLREVAFRGYHAAYSRPAESPPLEEVALDDAKWIVMGMRQPLDVLYEEGYRLVRPTVKETT